MTEARFPDPSILSLARRRKKPWDMTIRLPGKWMVRAYQLGSSAQWLALVIAHCCRVKRRAEVRLCLKALKRYGLDDTTARRSLRLLEEAGMVKVTRRGKRPCSVSLITTNPDSP